MKLSVFKFLGVQEQKELLAAFILGRDIMLGRTHVSAYEAEASAE